LPITHDALGGSRGVQVVRVQTGVAPLTRTCQGWESPRRKQRWQLKTDQNGNGVKVWSDASTWTRVESRSRINAWWPCLKCTKKWRAH